MFTVDVNNNTTAAVSRDGFPKLLTEQPTETSLRQEVLIYYFAKSTILALLSGHYIALGTT